MTQAGFRRYGRRALGLATVGLLAAILAACTGEVQQVVQGTVRQNLNDAQQTIQAFLHDFSLQALAAYLL